MENKGIETLGEEKPNEEIYSEAQSQLGNRVDRHHPIAERIADLV